MYSLVHVTFNCCSYCLVTKSCPTLCNPMDCSPPDSFVHGIFQARILEFHSPKSSDPLPLPQSPKDCSIHLCLFCCHVRNESPDQVQYRMLGAGALGWPRGMARGGRKHCTKLQGYSHERWKTSPLSQSSLPGGRDREEIYYRTNVFFPLVPTS